MKSKVFLIALLFVTTSLFSQSSSINYKALIKDNLGNVVANQTIDVRFTVIADTGPTNVYLETHTGATTDSNGIIILNIGGGTTNDVFTDIAWGSDVHSLKVEIDIEQDASFVDMGTTQFMAVPYALSAANAASKIDDLSDGKSDANGSSLFLGIDAGGNDDGTDNRNIAVGFEALQSNTSGRQNTATGYQSLYSNTTAIWNTANGYKALFSNDTGEANTAIGTLALYSNTEGFSNIAIGRSALYYNDTGAANTATGRAALFYNTTGINNTANGYQALLNNISDHNTAIGSEALFSNTVGFTNTAVGRTALYSNTEGFSNTAIGSEALYSNELGQANTATGRLALYNNTSDNNTANGYQALYSNTVGFLNTAVGTTALYSNTEGFSNTAIGSEVLFSNDTGSKNTAIGRLALYSNIDGNDNTATGYRALFNNLGSGNVALGSNAGFNETGDNTLYIANSDTSTPLIYGEFDNEILTLNGSTTVYSSEITNQGGDYALSGIRTQAGNTWSAGVRGENIVLDGFGYGVSGQGGHTGVSGVVLVTGDGAFNARYGVKGTVRGYSDTHSHYGVFGFADGDGTNYGVYASGDLGYTGALISASDRKLKTNIKKLSNGMATIMSLQPSAYSFKESYQKSMHVSNKPQFGFMAQELQTVLPELVSENKHPDANKEDETISYLGINYIGLIPILTAGIQEQEEHIKTLESKIDSQSQTIESLISRLEALENR